MQGGADEEFTAEGVREEYEIPQTFPEAVIDDPDFAVIDSLRPEVTADQIAAIIPPEIRQPALPTSWPAVERAVVAITGPGGEPGTGFFIAPNRVLTAKHIVSDQGSLRGRRISWGLLLHGTPIELAADLDNISASPTLDFTVFGVVGMPDEAVVLPLADHATPVIGAPVMAYGHPSGRYLRRSGRDANIVDVLPEQSEARYRADTMSGFSGGPVFDVLTARLVAMHTTGNEADRYNVGCLISAIDEELRGA